MHIPVRPLQSSLDHDGGRHHSVPDRVDVDEGGEGRGYGTTYTRTAHTAHTTQGASRHPSSKFGYVNDPKFCGTDELFELLDLPTSASQHNCTRMDVHSIDCGGMAQL